MNLHTIPLGSKMVFVAAVTLLCVAPKAGAASGETPIPVPESSRVVARVPASHWSFSLLPRAFQKHPRVDFNVITEMTDAGRQAPRATPENPIYYDLFFDRSLDLASRSSNGSKTPRPEYLEDALRKGLAGRNLLRAVTGHPASLLLICHWGQYSQGDFIDGIDSVARSQDEVLSRARLIGGEKFAKEFEKAIAEQELLLRATSGPSHPVENSVLGRPTPVIGDMMMPGTWCPVERFMALDERNRHLVTEATRGCYFVVVSAYDSKMALEGKRRLHWRTKMTVNDDGVSMAETLIPLVANTSHYLAADMSDAAVVVSQVDREGRVEFGPAEVLYWIDDVKKAKEPQRPENSGHE